VTDIAGLVLAAPVSSEVQDLIAGLMKPKPEERLGCTAGGCEAIKSHPWFTGFDWDAVSNNDNNQPTRATYIHQKYDILPFY
jgi:serine/threonine protein kinase